MASGRGEETGAGARLELATGSGAEGGRVGSGAVTGGRERGAAVGLCDQAAEREAAVRDGGVAGDGGAAGAVELRQEGALGHERGGGIGVIDRREQRAGAGIVGAD